MPVNWDFYEGKKVNGPDYFGIGWREMEGKIWLGGRYNDRRAPGSKKARIMIIGPNPSKTDMAMRTNMTSAGALTIEEMLNQFGAAEVCQYYTTACKYGTKDFGSPKVGDLNACRKTLLQEIQQVDPEVIVTLGSHAARAVMTEKYKLTAYRGSVVELDHLPGIKVVPCWSPGFIARDPSKRPELEGDIRKVVSLLRGQEVKDHHVDEFELITSAEQFADYLWRSYEEAPNRLAMFSTDLEWHGHHREETGYPRLMQMHGYAGTAVVKFFPCSDDESGFDPDVVQEGCADVKEVMNMLSNFIEGMESSGRGKIGFVGHNLNADGVWLRRYGVDIRFRTVYDTMLAEHLICNLGPFGLSEMTLKYTDMGRYDRPLEDWKRENPGKTKYGYGAIPDDILIPYGAGDVQAVWKIMMEQSTNPRFSEITRPRGYHNQYPSLLNSTLILGGHLYELEETGIPIDRVWLDKVTQQVNDKYRDLRCQLETMALAFGWNEFNPGSTVQVQKLLYNQPEDDPKGIGLVPIKTTGKRSKDWEWVMQQPEEKRKEYSPSTDQLSLETLEGQHEIVNQLLNMRRVEVLCKNFLREDETGGIQGNLWPDGRLHPEFSPMTDTGRLRSRKPNVQNWPKASEGKLVALFDGETPPSMRPMIMAPEGWWVLECDYKQAELFVLGGLSDDPELIHALTTPGNDLHDITAIASFYLEVLFPDMSVAEPQVLLDLAAKDLKAFEKLQKTLLYRDPKGKIMTRSEFKSTIRVSAKAVNFGIPYGRGAAAIAVQVNAETGLGVSVEEIQQGVDGWKRKFRVAWATLERYMQSVSKLGYVESPWGRRRYFQQTESRAMLAANEREAANFPIQSTVADTMAIAIDRIAKERNRRNMRFRLMNQVHDAFIALIPDEELEEAQSIIDVGMSGVEIPMPHGTPLRLETDMDISKRWCEAV